MVYGRKEETMGELMELINHKRNVMLKVAKQYGIGSKITLKYSQELDDLIIKYQRIVR
ncbi:aspartyl-phosphate phosphatase Spo0E family protein [Oceanobacillus senegalensis]|uniref:aspartyl-phosphate phosphatase Spo0E family protein n=1 Tax=Oceanobacillus senegalensis TaxID=1936063 RepID=UPI000A305362|nr:aspartyl-phosphate phosphatase Spo0E family protein [Oceanobacillus senegalensis]